jgi:hypothetical protein
MEHLVEDGGFIVEDYQSSRSYASDEGVHMSFVLKDRLKGYKVSIKGRNS